MEISVPPANVPTEEDDRTKQTRRLECKALEGSAMTRFTVTFRRSARLLRTVAVVGTLGILLLAGCHTTAGFGQDMQSVGRNIQNSANKNNK